MAVGCDAGWVHGPPVARRDQLVDIAIAVAFGLLSALLIAGVVDGAADRAVAGALATAHIAPLVVRRRWPVWVITAMAATALLTVPVGVPVLVLGPAIGVGVYTVGSSVEPTRAKQVLGGLLVLMAVVVTANGSDGGTLVTNTVALTLVWWLGDRARRAALETEAERAAMAEAVRQATLDERLRIARELHDVVAHAMSVIAVQAGTGRFVIDESPAIAAEALATIETTSRGALEEMRRMLEVLRDHEASGELFPAPGLADLGALVEANLDAGLDVEVVTEGQAVDLPSGLDLCVFRIVQEALTNVRKHAHASRAVVRVRYDESILTVEVRDDGVGAHGAGGEGHGLVGMRERAALYAGSIEMGPADGHGYRVLARFPLGEPV
jgi:signal transduction histidine kinase